MAAATEKVETKKSPLDMARTYLEKSFGKGVLMNLEGSIDTRDCIDAGHPFINYVTGGGVPYGKHVEVYGFESSGKSTWAYTVAAKAQKRKGQKRPNGKFYTGRVLILDYEHAFDKKYFKRQGGLTSEEALLVAQPENAEEGFEVMRVLIDSELIDLVIVDSVAAMMSYKESAQFVNSDGNVVADGKGKQQGAMGEQRIGLHAQVITQALKQLSARIGAHGVSIIWINQIRTKINTTGRPSTETTTGGNALKFYAAIRLEFRKMSAKTGNIYNPFTNTIEKGNIALNTLVKAVKNKEAPPFREAPVTIRFGDGLSVEDDLLDLAVARKLVVKGKTGWFETKAIGATRNARGEDDFRRLLKEEPVVFKKIMDSIDLEKIVGEARVIEEPLPPEDADILEAAGVEPIQNDAEVDKLLNPGFVPVLDEPPPPMDQSGD